ncbi:hypothetical protein C8F01DRAFT_1170438 [Mycena amicta]|nr:hypothetical protein C8F01DRAFT_1170438 [Mycena amicta]
MSVVETTPAEADETSSKSVNTSTFSTAAVAAAAAAANTPASLAALLATALTDVDALREEMALTRQRADRAERLLTTFGLVSASLTAQSQEPDTKPATNGTDANPTPLPQATVTLLLALDERAITAERERDELSARLATLTSNWSQLEAYMGSVEASVREARRGYARVVREEGDVAAGYDYRAPHPISLPPLPFSRANDSKRTRTDSMFSIDGYASANKRPRAEGDYDGVSVSVFIFRYLTSTLQYSYPQSRRSTYVTANHRPIPPPHHHHHHHPLDRQPTVPNTNASPFAPYSDRSPARQPSHLTQRSRSRSRSLSAGGSEDLDAMLLDSTTGNMQVRREKERGGTMDGRAPATVPNPTPGQPFPARNAQNQRLCRQCGLAGRYKDGRCVEKWGPGPMGPGTVCDRCRKRAKRVERRGTGSGILVGGSGTSDAVPITTAGYMAVERESSIRSSLAGPVPAPAPSRTLSVAVSAATSNSGTPLGAPGILPPLRTHSPMEADIDADGLLDGDAEAEVDEAAVEPVPVASAAAKLAEPADLDMDLLEAVDAAEKAAR